jgi:hypothetical protein
MIAPAKRIVQVGDETGGMDEVDGTVAHDLVGAAEVTPFGAPGPLHDPAPSRRRRRCRSLTNERF